MLIGIAFALLREFMHKPVIVEIFIITGDRSLNLVAVANPISTLTLRHADCPKTELRAGRFPVILKDTQGSFPPVVTPVPQIVAALELIAETVEILEFDNLMVLDLW